MKTQSKLLCGELTQASDGSRGDRTIEAYLNNHS